MIWQDCLRCRMKVLGFKESLRETKGVEMIAHVDDLIVVKTFKMCIMALLGHLK